MYSVVIERIYKDAQGQWQRSPSIDERSMLAAAKVIEECWKQVQDAKGGGVSYPESSGQNNNGGGGAPDDNGGSDEYPPF